MPRVAHGSAATPEQLRQAHEALAERAGEVALGFAVAAPLVLENFDFLFPDLQDNPANLLPRSATTVRRLKELGRAMVDPGPATGDSNVPAVYTYFGQFVDHDITFEASSFSSPAKLVDDALVPLPLDRIRNELKNTRTAILELDSLYALPAKRDPANQARLLIGKVTKLNGTQIPEKRPPGKGDDNDLPRDRRRPGDPKNDRAAFIGDPRNDENLIVAQLHLAFLKAHNRLVDQGRTFEEARRILRQHYQQIVLHDFLKRIADPAIVDDVIAGGNRFYDATGPFFLPLEFTVAGFRFGHTMIRDTYDFNLNFPDATLDLLFTFTALSGQLGDFDTLPDSWIIQWERFIAPGGGKNKARRFDTKLSPGLFQLRRVDGSPERPDDAAHLPIRNLLRGYALRMPTGQALATRLDLPVLSRAELEAAAASERQARALKDSGFLERTPLWYYLLAEARHNGGQRLGPVGSTLVAEVLVGLARRSTDSILATPGWVPSLPSAKPGRFELADLLRFAKVVGGGAAPKTYKVKKGDSLSSIAKAKLGDAKRWPELFVLNRAKIRHRDMLDVGQVLSLPAAPMQPRPLLYKVKSGDTLSSIAKAKLGDANRWPEIHRLNRDLVPNPNQIVPGLELVIVPR